MLLFTMNLLLLGFAILLASGIVASFLDDKRGNLVGGFGSSLGALFLLASSLSFFFGQKCDPISIVTSVPNLTVSLGIDSLSAFFLGLLAIISATTAIYGVGYLASSHAKIRIGYSWLCFNILIMSMAIVVVATNAMFFLIAWEVMTISSFLLVTVETSKDESRKAGWMYLVASQLGTGFLIAFFLYLGSKSGSLDFTVLREFAHTHSIPAYVFIFALIGFGTKAGLMPFHVWLPEAHPAAPTHVSALMSGVMIKTGIYGLFRTVFLIGEIPHWVGSLVLMLGVVSGIGGILLAIAQQDIKRLLAYSSVENVGIIAVGIGLGLMASASGLPELAAIGYTGALLHSLNHAFFKSLLFMGAGVAINLTGTRTIDRMGGLIKRIPAVSFLFLIAAFAISGLPPLNGFISEFLIYFGLIKVGIFNTSNSNLAPSVIALMGLALIGGLAAACFTKLFGIAFLGEPRSKYREDWKPGGALIAPMAFLALACVTIAFSAPWVIKFFLSAVLLEILPGLSVPHGELTSLLSPLLWIFIGIIILGSIVSAIRYFLPRSNKKTVGTWDCGYLHPSPKMQYTASSFAEPIVQVFGRFLRGDWHIEGAQFLIKQRDVFDDYFYFPIFRWLDRGLKSFRRIQHGKTQAYVSYIFITLVFLLILQAGLK